MARRVHSRRHPTLDVHAGVRSLLSGAIEAFDGLDAAASDAVDGHAVHEVRKRCKEARALARLMGAPAGRRAERFDVAVRDAGRAIASLRDADALDATLESLADRSKGDTRAAVTAVQMAHRGVSRTACDVGADPNLTVVHLETALGELERWRPDAGFDPLAEGVGRSYRAARRGLAAAIATDDDEHLHEWRKAVKRLWYQTRAMRDLAPSALGPMVDVLDRLSDLLGDDHDLAVLAQRLDDAPGRYGAEHDVRATIAAARAHQRELRSASLRLGATLFAERTGAFRRRIESYWTLTRELGPEPVEPR